MTDLTEKTTFQEGEGQDETNGHLLQEHEDNQYVRSDGVQAGGEAEGNSSSLRAGYV